MALEVQHALLPLSVPSHPAPNMAPLLFWTLAAVLGGSPALAAPVVGGTTNSGYDYVSLVRHVHGFPCNG